MSKTLKDLDERFGLKIDPNRPETTFRVDYKAHTLDAICPACSYTKRSPYWLGFSQMLDESGRMHCFAVMMSKDFSQYVDPYVLAGCIGEIKKYVEDNPNKKWKN